MHRFVVKATLRLCECGIADMKKEKSFLLTDNRLVVDEIRILTQTVLKSAKGRLKIEASLVLMKLFSRFVRPFVSVTGL